MQVDTTIPIAFGVSRIDYRSIDCMDIICTTWNSVIYAQVTAVIAAAAHYHLHFSMAQELFDAAQL